MKPRVVVCSIFRNSSPYINRYFHQIGGLFEAGLNLELVLTEGDSVDMTWTELQAHVNPFVHLVHMSHGGPHFGSVDHPQRWEQIASVVRPTVARALDLNPDVVVWIESDLMWETGTMTQLIDSVAAGLDRTSAPMVFAGDTPRFYDIWGYRMNGKMFLAQPPYLPEDPFHFQQPGSDLVHIDSCGSCFATSDLDALDKWDGIWPYFAGGNIKLHTNLAVRHP